MTHPITEIDFSRASIEALKFYIVSNTNDQDVELLDQQDRLELKAYSEYVFNELENGDMPKPYQDWMEGQQGSDPTDDWGYDTTGSNSNYNYY